MKFLISRIIKVFYKSRLSFYLIFFFVLYNSFGQVGALSIDSKKIHESITKSKELINKKTSKDYYNGIKLLDELESELTTNKDTINLLLFYKKAIELYLEVGDYASPENYIKKGLKILKKHDNKRELGLFFEAYGVLYNLQQNTPGNIKYYLISEKLLRQYGNYEDNIDINFNLALGYKSNYDWKKAIYHSKLALEYIKKTNQKTGRERYLNFFICESYLNLKEKDKAYEYLVKVENDSLFDSSDAYLLAYYSQIKGDYYYELRDYKNSLKYHIKSEIKFKELYTQSYKQSSKLHELIYVLKLKNFENEKAKNEIRFRNITASYERFLFILGLIIIVMLSISVVFLSRASRYKTKVNSLLKTSNSDLKKINEDLKIALKVKKEFLDTVTHELKTPLNTIKGISYLLKNQDFIDQKEEHIKNLDFSSDYLLNFIDNVMNYKMLENSKYKLQKKEFDLREMLTAIIKMFKVNNTNNNKIKIDFDEVIPSVLKSDPVRLTQIIIELMTNAIKFTKKGKVILRTKLIRSENDKVIIEFSVCDTGIGISNKFRDKIFEPFIQESEQINRNYGGSGLGLSIIKKTLDLFNSDIKVESEKNKGTTFSFLIDFEVVVKNKENIEFIIEKEKSFFDFEILLVEDNKINQLLTKKILIDKGFKCYVASDGVEAVAKVKEKKYDIILMDIMMPIMNGFEASKIINDLKPEIPIVALTAISEDITSSAFQKSKILEKLDKPINVDILFKTILKYVEQKKL